MTVQREERALRCSPAGPGAVGGGGGGGTPGRVPGARMAAAEGGGGEREEGGCPAVPAGEVLRDTAGDPLRRLRKAEAVLARRTRRLVVVLEKSRESRDHEALLRTCDCLGIQHVFIVHAGEQVSKQAVPSKKLRARDRRGPWVGSGILKKSSSACRGRTGGTGAGD